MSYQSFIDKSYDERYQRVNGIETDKLGIMSSQSCTDKYSDERDQRENYYETDKLGIMSSHILLGDILIKEMREEMIFRQRNWE